MKVDLTIAKTIIGKTAYYVVINDTFYIAVKKKLFYELADYLKVDLVE